MLKELTLSIKSVQLPPMNKASQRILGFLIAAGGDNKTGSTIRDIAEGTGLAVNTVYVALRQNIPGVVKCLYHTNSGAAMYYCDLQTAQEHVPAILTREIKVSAQQTILDSKEWANVPDKIFGAVGLVVDEKPINTDRLIELANTALTLDPDDENYYYKWAMAGQAIAIIALKLAAGDIE